MVIINNQQVHRSVTPPLLRLGLNSSACHQRRDKWFLRNREREAAAMTGHGFHPDRAPVFADDSLHEVQTEAFTVMSRFITTTHERLEERFDPFLRDARSIVSNGEHVGGR